MKQWRMSFSGLDLQGMFLLLSSISFSLKKIKKEKN